jgi:hypothetical protein
MEGEANGRGWNASENSSRNVVRFRKSAIHRRSKQVGARDRECRGGCNFVYSVAFGY